MNDTARLARLPLPLPDELSRPRLLERLNGRWHAPVTVIQAGAGFGKSTLLAQAVRANTLEPRGIDVWHACTPGDVDGEVLGQAVLERARRGGPVSRSGDPDRRRPGRVLADRRLRRARRRPRGPAGLVGRRAAGSPGSPPARQRPSRPRRSPRTIGSAVAAPRRGPAGGDRPGRPAVHRATRPPPWPIGSAAYRTRPSRSAAGPPSCAWRSRCGPTSPSTSPRRRCSATSAATNAAPCSRCRTSAMPTASASGRVVGETVDLAHLAAAVPLVSRTEDGLFRAHDLWTEALLRVLTPEEVAAPADAGSSTSWSPSGDLRPRRRVGHGARRRRRVGADRGGGRPSQHRRAADRHGAALVLDCCNAAGRTPPRPDCSSAALRQALDFTDPARRRRRRRRRRGLPRPRRHRRRDRGARRRHGRRRTCAAMSPDSSSSPVEPTPSPARATTP